MFQHFHSALTQHFGDLDPIDRWEAVKGKLCLQLLVGRFDKGYDLILHEQTLDVKTYNKKILTRKQVMRYNLFVNVNEVRHRAAAHLYIQTFLIADNKIILAGYHQGLPSETRRDIRSPAYACPVQKLLPISDLTNQLVQ